MTALVFPSLDARSMPGRPDRGDPQLTADAETVAWAGGIATLGPSGTSSEAVAHQLARRIDQVKESSVSVSSVDLYPTYEEASDAVISGKAARLLVANAYHGIDRFYMNLRLKLEQAFVFDTPRYGLVVRAAHPVPMACRVVTHPAPRDLITQLMPPGYGAASVEFASSTSAAARRAADGGAEIALTTEPAAALHDLRFISATRPIRMLWSVFTRSRRDT